MSSGNSEVVLRFVNKAGGEYLVELLKDLAKAGDMYSPLIALASPDVIRQLASISTELLPTFSRCMDRRGDGKALLLPLVKHVQWKFENRPANRRPSSAYPVLNLSQSGIELATGRRRGLAVPAVRALLSREVCRR